MHSLCRTLSPANAAIACNLKEGDTGDDFMRCLNVREGNGNIFAIANKCNAAGPKDEQRQLSHSASFQTQQ